jgi:hypothetical protein
VCNSPVVVSENGSFPERDKTFLEKNADTRLALRELISKSIDNCPTDPIEGIPTITVLPTRLQSTKRFSIISANRNGTRGIKSIFIFLPILLRQRSELPSFLHEVSLVVTFDCDRRIKYHPHHRVFVS